MSTATKSKTTRKPAIKIEVVEDPADDKKKGRKPKGAKLVVKPPTARSNRSHWKTSFST
jgi:hypothetical protein